MKRVFRKIVIIIATILLFGSSSITTMAKDTANNEYQVDIHIKVEKNLIVNQYDVKFIIDGETKSVMKQGKSQDFQVMLSSGEHVLSFEKKDDPGIKGKTKLNVTSKLECSYTIKPFNSEVSVTENYVDYNIELPEGKVKTTKSASDFRKKNYKTVVSESKEMGFTNISEKPIEKKLFKKEGELDAIRINGQYGFKRGEVYDSDTEVLITYFTEKKEPEEQKKKEPEEQKKKEPEEQKKKEPEVTPTPTVLPYETVVFGNYGEENIEWRVLDKKDDATLLITKDIIDYRAFNDTTQAEPSDWGHSTLRHWLNEDFYHSAFSDEERNAIQTTTVQDYKSEDICGEQTQDHIFILSLDQAFSYFNSDRDRIAHATEYAKIRKKVLSGSSISSDSYWLINSYMGDLYKYLISPKGNIDNKPRVNENEGIRPAMWVSNDALK